MVMAACMDAVAPPGINDSESFGCPTYARILVFKIYSRETFLRIRVTQAAKTMRNGCDLDILHQHGILSEPASHRRRKWKRCECKQKRGKRAGICARLKAKAPSDQQYHRLYSPMSDHLTTAGWAASVERNPLRMERLLCVYFHGKLATGQYPRCGHTARGDDGFPSGQRCSYLR